MVLFPINFFFEGLEISLHVFILDISDLDCAFLI